jgi:type VI secretion system secreted protein Hcp
MAIDAFLKFEGGSLEIKGDSVVEGHKDELQIQSFSWGVSNSGSRHMGTGGGTGKGNFGDMSVMMFTDRSSPALMLAVGTGAHIDTATLVVRKAGGDEAVDFLKFTMTDCLVSSWSTSGSNGSDVSTDSFSVNFAHVQFEFVPQGAAGGAEGSVSHAFDIAAGARA